MGKTSTSSSEIIMDSSSDDDIENEFKGLMNTSVLNKRYLQYKSGVTATSNDDLSETKDTQYEVKEPKETKSKRTNKDEQGLFERLLRLTLPLVRRKPAAFLLLLIINIILIISMTSKNDEIIPNVKSFGDISKSLQQLQWQINDLNSKNKNRLNDLRNYLDLKIDEFNLRFTQIDNSISDLSVKQQQLESLSLDGIDIDSSKIPVILDNHNNVKVLPEFESFLEAHIKSVILEDQDIKSRFKVDYETLVERYVNHIINNKVGFMSKDEILSLINLKFQDNKKSLIEELKNNKIPISSDKIPKRLINYNDGKKSDIEENRLNYAQASAGARIINYLTSSTFKPKYKESSALGSLISGWFGFTSSSTSQGAEESSELHDLDQLSYTPSPFVVLTSNDGYWRSSEIKDTTLAIKFLEPIYLTKISYDHHFPLNGALLTSAPHHLSIFVQSDMNDEILAKSEFDTTLHQGKYVKIGQYKYDINGANEQEFAIPGYLKKFLIRSILIQVNDNYGNEFFTSFYKLRIEGLTRFDIHSIKQLLQNQDIDDSIKSRFDEFRQHAVRKIGEDDEFV